MNICFSWYHYCGSVIKRYGHALPVFPDDNVDQGNAFVALVASHHALKLPQLLSRIDLMLSR